MAEVLGTKDLCNSLHTYIHTHLDEREATVLTVRYGLSGNEAKTQRETADLLGISRSYVSRIEKKALEKLRHIIDDP